MESLPVFLKQITSKNPQADVNLISKAYKYAMVAHAGQKRATGEDFFEHPYGVTKIALDMGFVQTTTLCAALLHDIVEDTTVSIEQIEKEFNKEIAMLIEGLTKIDKKETASREENLAKNRRKIILATAKDPRVMIIKLCDRLHNIESLDIFRREKQIRIATETIEVYAPIAEKLGLWRLQGLLEDQSFRYLHPKEYDKIREEIILSREQRDAVTKQLVAQIQQYLHKHSIEVRSVRGRAKYFYSIYKKMMSEKKSFEDIHDLYGIRIIARRKSDCYTVVEMLKKYWNFVPKFYKDYIANPRPNGYRSVHANFSVGDKIIEIQTRTRLMDEHAELGSAIHWKYKGTEKDRKFDQKLIWMKEFIHWFRTSGVTQGGEITIDVFKNEIVTITPKGDPIILPEGATPIDFAYAIHSRVGDHIGQVIINGKNASLQSQLQSGDIVSINTKKEKTVNQNWLKSVKSTEAASKIRKSLNIVAEPKPSLHKQKKHQKEEKYSEIETLADLHNVKGKQKVKLSKCCNPRPGDNIVAFYTKDKKHITVHKRSCPNQYALDQLKKVNIAWSQKQDKGSEINVLIGERSGMISRMLEKLYNSKVKIRHITTTETKSNLRVIFMVDSLTPKRKEAVKEAIKELKSIKRVQIE